ncbi:heavy metal translocating P-type ATPase [Microvirga puerhi]|uniref:P-type Zn(2+) transporter n=1 Tax=Microvirga puerhi TaxID=2876078 RepID=A0ABS7VNS0_9HYPH|nr:heavy metal translocating P-type ATPase [Microvirga puerhi]MBZ6077181.1 heavy metal translocating P-type ATPase [Microvirga puerhi]
MDDRSAPLDASASQPLPVSGLSSLQTLQQWSRPFLVAAPALGLLLGGILYGAGLSRWAGWTWAIATVPVLAALLVEISLSLRRGDVGLDIVAALSMAGALALGEYLAGAVVALMYAGGQYLENFAERRATRDMTALLSRVPQTALRDREGRLEEIPLAAVEPGDRLLVRRGEIVPVDGTTADGIAVLDQAALTGESIPVQVTQGEAVLSGSMNAGDAFTMVATRMAAESTYAGIVRLVAQAQQSKAPMARMADRFAIVFLAATVAMAGGAWLWTGDPVRALAVLVVATPCPLILAVPVAIVAGVSRAAKAGILVKGGKALEAMARVRSLVLDKTGTLTHGEARVTEIRPVGTLSPERLLALAASLDQASNHVIAKALVREARERGLELVAPTAVTESPGEGLTGTVEGHALVVGGPRFVVQRVLGAEAALHRGPREPGSVRVAVAMDGQFAGTLTLADGLRAGTARLLDELRTSGIGRIVLATGDRRDVAEAVTAGLPIDATHAELTPGEKIAVVQAERPFGPVMMIGDGINDAPALAAADLGVAMGAKGAAASADAADVVLLVDRLDRIATGLRIAQRSRAIALQSVYAGIGLSFLGMIAAAFGYLAPVEGAVVQEAIDVAVILNALRALHGRAESSSSVASQAPGPVEEKPL